MTAAERGPDHPTTIALHLNIPASAILAESHPEPSTSDPTPPEGEPNSGTRERVAPAGDALDDPAFTAGHKGYRSFYIDDEPFARFRAAVYWLSRHPEGSQEVPANMSVAVEHWMREVAADLERRYNDGKVFRAPPASRRRA